MTTHMIQTIPSAGNRFNPWVRRAGAFNPMLTLAGLLHLGLLPLLLLAWAVDPKTISTRRGGSSRLSLRFPVASTA